MDTKKGLFKYHILMALVMVFWGLEYSIAKDALDNIPTVVVLNFKFLVGSLVVIPFMIKFTGFHLPAKKDLPIILALAFFGQISYFFCEYSAISMIPVANVSVILGFLPMGTVLLERLIYKRAMSGKLIVFILISIIGVTLTIGGDLAGLAGGKAFGYVFAMGTMISQLAYLFITDHLGDKYDPVLLTFCQTSISWILTLPIAAPKAEILTTLTPMIWMELLYLGIVAEGLLFLAEVLSIIHLGPTVSAVYTNFLPVTSAFFGVILLSQHLIPVQYLGGALVIAFGLFTIREKNRLSKAYVGEHL